MRRRAFSLTVLATAFGALTGCQSLKDIQKLRKDLKKEFGVDSSVTVETSDDTKTVTVLLSPTPSGDVADVKRRATEIVKRHMGESTIVKVDALMWGFQQ